MNKKNNLEKIIAGITGISLLGTMISLFFNNWKFSIVLLLIYVLSSDLFLGYKLAEMKISNSVNNVIEDVFNTMKIKNEED